MQTIGDEIREIIRSQPIPKALVMLREQRDEAVAIRDAQNDIISALTPFITNLEALVPDSEIAGAEEPPAPLPSGFVSPQASPDLDDVIVDHLREVGRTTLHKICAVLQKFPESDRSYGAVYYRVIGSRYSLEKRGVVQVWTNTRPATIELNPGFKPKTSDNHYLDILLECDPRALEHEAVARKLAEAIGVYTEQVLWPKHGGKRYHAARTWKLIKTHGLIGSICAMVDRDTTRGFEGLEGIGRSDLSAERIVLDHADAFPAKTVNNATLRLERREQKAA